MKQEIVKSISERLLTTRDGRSKTNWLWKFKTEADKSIETLSEEIYNLVVGKVLVGIVGESPFTRTAIAIGQAIRLKYNIPQEKDETQYCLHCGSKVLEAFCNADKPDHPIQMLNIKKINAPGMRHAMYELRCTDMDMLEVLLLEEDITEMTKFPLFEPMSDWSSGYHDEINTQLIRNAGNSTLKEITVNSAPRVYSALNKLKNTGYLINPEIFEVYRALIKKQDKSAFMNKAYKPVEDTPFKHEKEEMIASRIGMYTEAKFIEALARSIGDRVFYQAYNCDFRGRIYPLTPYLHEQSSDNAKGLLKYASGVALGDNGAYWLGVHMANSIGEDKLPLDDRAQYVEDNMEEILSWAEEPLTNIGWMKADKPWSTLACAYEFSKIRDWILIGGNPIEEYQCNVPIFIDGSNNGVQHLTALSLDEKIAPLVNLVPTDLPGDVYMYIADKTWEALAVEAEQYPDDHKIYKWLPRVQETVKKLKMQREVAGTSDEKSAIYRKLDIYRKRLRKANIEQQLWVPFWGLLAEDKKLQRKTVKRPVMTLGYGVTLTGVKDQVFVDTRNLSEDLKFKDKKWSDPFSILLYNTMLSSLEGPAIMLDLFRQLAESASNQNKQLTWQVPITNFPAKHSYIKLPEEEVRVQFCKIKPKGFQLVIRPPEGGKLDRRKQLLGAAPNIVHSFDAAHLTMIVDESPFTVTTVHDSFGCHPGNMNDLFRITREQFIKFYETDPLAQLLAQRNAVELYPTRGSLDITEVLKSDFAFA